MRFINDCVFLLSSLPVYAEEETDYLTGLRKGEDVVQDFIDSISFIKDDIDYYQKKNFFIFVSDNSAWGVEWFLESNSSHTEDEWLKMSLFDRFVWFLAYHEPSYELQQSDSYEEYMEDTTSWIFVQLKNIDSEKAEIIKEALLELYQWHYDYYIVTGSVYNYYDIDNATMETTENAKANNSLIGDGEKETEIATENVTEMEMATETEATTEKENSGVDRILSALGSALFGIILTIVVGVIYFVIRKKQKK